MKIKKQLEIIKGKTISCGKIMFCLFQFLDGVE